MIRPVGERKRPTESETQAAGVWRSGRRRVAWSECTERTTLVSSVERCCRACNPRRERSDEEERERTLDGVMPAVSCFWLPTTRLLLYLLPPLAARALSARLCAVAAGLLLPEAAADKAGLQILPLHQLHL